MLEPGTVFPQLPIHTIAHGDMVLPDALAGRYGVVLLYRGAWCPYCNAQLRAFQHARASLEKVGAQVVALSVDDEDTTRELADKHQLSYPIGFGASAHEIAQATGAFVNPDPAYLQSTGFVLDRTGRILVSVYSSGAIGRLVPADVVGLIEYVDGMPREA
ncbi:redoxin domain-containing protein [Leekyejoonella antrihumi]|uniref:thioredoxin-dependent peroxiredoxin n=1 Tax=Leekyejoonella antrihumi TaxID=1660198 RepID=A0A563DXH4_9MICO|nr:redoxin domain-containing protein [Leekyejoonella antrihumi]TWP34960.1 peroxiredoxin family protein [Leekyejoonella antrihumi]